MAKSVKRISIDLFFDVDIDSITMEQSIVTLLSKNGFTIYGSVFRDVTDCYWATSPMHKDE